MMNTKTIVLPGFGNPVTFTPKEDTTIGVRVNGRIVDLKLQANVATKVQFLSSMATAPLAAA